LVGIQKVIETSEKKMKRKRKRKAGEKGSRKK